MKDVESRVGLSFFNSAKFLIKLNIGDINLDHTLGKISRQQTDDIFFLVSQKIGSDISCKLSPKETICMKC